MSGTDIINIDTGSGGVMKDDKIDYYKIGKNVRFNLDEIKDWIMKYRTTNYSKIIDLKTDNFKTDKVYDEG